MTNEELENLMGDDQKHSSEDEEKRKCIGLGMSELDKIKQFLTDNPDFPQNLSQIPEEVKAALTCIYNGMLPGEVKMIIEMAGVGNSMIAGLCSIWIHGVMWERSRAKES